MIHDRELLQDSALLAGVSSYTATALENRELVGQLRSSLSELTESRARLVAVADEERQKIERDLHDGAQQRLVALQIKLAMIGEQMESEAAGVREAAAGVRGGDRRHARRGPPLRAWAVPADPRGPRAQGRAARGRANRGDPHDGRYAACPTAIAREVESAVYFACLEALQNAAQACARGNSGQHRVSGNGRLRFDVRDNGAGFDVEETPRNAGLTNMRDRVGALGGTLEIESVPGKGTHVTGMIPVDD